MNHNILIIRLSRNWTTGKINWFHRIIISLNIPTQISKKTFNEQINIDEEKRCLYNYLLWWEHFKATYSTSTIVQDFKISTRHMKWYLINKLSCIWALTWNPGSAGNILRLISYAQRHSRIWLLHCPDCPLMQVKCKKRKV